MTCCLNYDTKTFYLCHEHHMAVRNLKFFAFWESWLFWIEKQNENLTFAYIHKNQQYIECKSIDDDRCDFFRLFFFHKFRFEFECDNYVDQIWFDRVHYTHACPHLWYWKFLNSGVWSLHAVEVKWPTKQAHLRDWWCVSAHDKWSISVYDNDHVNFRRQFRVCWMWECEHFVSNLKCILAMFIHENQTKKRKKNTKAVL